MNLVTGPGPVVGEIARTPARTRWGSSARLRPADRSPAGGGGSCCSRWGQRSARDLRGRRSRQGGRGHPGRIVPERGAELHRGRALPRARGRPGGVPVEASAAIAEAITSVTRSTTRRPWGRSTTSRPRPRPSGTSRRRSSEGASIVVGGKRAPQHGSDLFFEATVLDGVNADMEIAREETFGPVVPVSSIRSEEEALEVVNGSPYGLLSAIFTRDLRRGLRFAEAVRTGWVNVNDGTNYWESHLPFGGHAGSQSGVARGRPLLDGAPHRAEDDRHRPVLTGLSGRRPRRNIRGLMRDRARTVVVGAGIVGTRPPITSPSSASATCSCSTRVRCSRREARARTRRGSRSRPTAPDDVPDRAGVGRAVRDAEGGRRTRLVRRRRDRGRDDRGADGSCNDGSGSRAPTGSTGQSLLTPPRPPRRSRCSTLDDPGAYHVPSDGIAKAVRIATRLHAAPRRRGRRSRAASP